MLRKMNLPSRGLLGHPVSRLNGSAELNEAQRRHGPIQALSRKSASSASGRPIERSSAKPFTRCCCAATELRFERGAVGRWAGLAVGWWLNVAGGRFACFLAPDWSTRKKAIDACSSSAWDASYSDVDDISSEALAFCWVTLSSCWIASLI